MSANVPIAGQKPGRRKIEPERLDYVERLYLRSIPKGRIQKWVCDRYGVTRRQARRYISLVEARFEKTGEPASSAAVLALAETMVLEGYLAARKRTKVVVVDKVAQEFSAPDTSAMVTAGYRLAELHGAIKAKAQRVEVSGLNGGAIEHRFGSLSDDELDARIAELEKRIPR